MIDDTKLGADEAAEQAQADLRDGIERARECLSDARLAMIQQEAPKAEPPNPAV